MKKIYKKLTNEQKKRGVIFSSCLSSERFELKGDMIHEVLTSDKDKEKKIKRLKDDKFFNESHFKFNIIRK
jgi:hypothetical protein